MAVTSPLNGKLADVLREHAVDKFTGVLRVDGLPGGAIYLSEGRIAACETPGAPSLEVILLRSGRVPEADWNAAFSVAAMSGRPMTDVLVEREVLGAGEIEALLRIALADAIFAVVSGRVDGWAEGPAADCPLPLDPPAKPGWLLSEATRRAQALAAFSGPALTAQDRAAIAPGTTRGGRALGQGQDEILALTDGRRTPRDLAFALGRGLYETLLQLSRMRDAGVIVLISRDREPGRPADPARRGAADGDETVAGLPRRGKDRPAAPRATGSRRSLTANMRVLRPRTEGNTLPDGNQ
jgi:hypothetical protein